MNTKATLPVLTLFLSAVFFAACLPTQQAETTPAVNTDAVMETNQVQPDSEFMMEDPSEMESSRALTIETAYTSPAGEEDVAFVVTIDEAGVITNAETTVMAKSPISIARQKSFAEELPSVVIGMNLNELTSIDRVGGSSLTTGAFNEALAEFKAQL